MYIYKEHIDYTTSSNVKKKNYITQIKNRTPLAHKFDLQLAPELEQALSISLILFCGPLRSQNKVPVVM